MNRKITLILALLILALVSVSIVTAVNNTHDSVATDNSKGESQSHIKNDAIAVEDSGSMQASQDKNAVGAGGITITKVWDDRGITITKVWDDNNAAGKRPSSISFAILVDGKEAETGQITGQNGWQATVDMQISQDSKYEVVEKDVPDGYEASVSGNVSDGFVITNTLKDNDTNKNATPSDKDPDNKEPSTNEPKNNAPDAPKTQTKVITTTTTKEVPAEDQADNERIINQLLATACPWHTIFFY